MAAVKAAAIVLASIYWPGDGIVGKHNYATSSGQHYNAQRMACAHKTLPLGSKLYLTRGSNHVEVTINDRGPFVRGRSLDCTPAVNEALHLGGLARVRAEPWPPLPTQRPKEAP